jgi:tripartite-type tricarboxylate transporter receptor subunit TctC
MLGPNGKEVVLGANAPGTANYDASVLLERVLGAKIKLVTGYPGTAETRKAIESGEVDGFVNSWESTLLTSKEQIDSGEWLIVSQLTEQPLRALPNVPWVFNLSLNDEQRQLFRFGLTIPNRFTRLIGVVPEVPADRAAALESAFAKTVIDQQFLSDAQRQQLDISPLTAADQRKLVTEYLSMPADVKTKLQQIMRPPGS